MPGKQKKNLRTYTERHRGDTEVHREKTLIIWKLIR
jgi:hypothetical protein